MLVFGYLMAIIMGGILGLIGGGGSILTVPILVYIFKVDASLATAYSLFIVGLASAFAALDYKKRNLIDFKTGVYFAIPAFIGVYSIRRFLVPSIPDSLGHFIGVDWTRDNLILVVFALVMLLASTTMIKGRKETFETQKKTPPWYLVIFEGLLVGGLTGFVGAGGGFMIIPALVILAGLEIKMAIGTSLFIITFKSLMGFLGDIQSTTNIDWSFLILFSAFATLGITIGTKISRRVDSRKLKPIFGWFVLVMGIVMLSKELLK